MKMICLIIFSALTLVTSLCGAYEEEDCVRCHGAGAGENRLHVPVEDFKASVHGRDVGCRDCHQEIVDGGHQRRKGSIRVACGDCHEKENLHGSGATEKTVPGCHDCHSKHTILGKDDPGSTVHPANLRRTCQGCHPVAGGKKDYLSWFPSVRVSSHGKEDFSRSYDMGNCIGCHQGKAAHGEDVRLSQDTCDKCHFRDAERGASLAGTMHPEADRNGQPGVFASALLHQAGLWVLVLAGIMSFVRFGSQTLKKRG